MNRSAVVALVLLLGLSAALRAPPNPYHVRSRIGLPICRSWRCRIQILGVSRSDSTSAIQAAYIALAKKWHPDRNSASSDIFDKIRQAFDVLSDRDKRSYYDRIGRYPIGNSVADIQDRAIQKYAELGALNLYNRDTDRFSMATLLTDETYPFFVEDNAMRFGTVWLVKLYASQCNGCKSIVQTWENLVQEYQGWVSFGRINYDLSATLVSSLTLRSIPEVFVVSRQGQTTTLTPLLQGNLNRLSSRAIADAVRSIPHPNKLTILTSEKEIDAFFALDKVAVVFISRLHDEIPLPLATFMFRTDLPDDVAFAFAPSSSKVASNSESDDDSYVLISQPPFNGGVAVPLLANWFQLLCIDSDVLSARLRASARPLYPQLTFDSYYETCYRPNATCIAVLTDSEPAAHRYIQGIRDLVPRLDLQNPESTVRLGWINGDQQEKLLRSMGILIEYRRHSLAVCILRPSAQQYQCFTGSDPHQFDLVINWAAVVAPQMASGSLRQEASALPFLQASYSSTSFDQESTQYFQAVFTFAMYLVLASGAILLLLVAPSWLY